MLIARNPASASFRVQWDLPAPDIPMNESLIDRKSTRLNSSHLVISYAVFCLKKKKKNLPSSDGCRCPPSPGPAPTPDFLLLFPRQPPRLLGWPHSPHSGRQDALPQVPHRTR